MLAGFLRTALSAVLVLSAAPALAASPDSQFAMQAAQGGLAEVQMARLATTKSRNAVVTSFAQRMIADHTANNAKLAAIMRSEGLRVPTTADPNAKAMMTRLQGLSGTAFDRAYIIGQVRAHGQMQILMQAEVNAGKDARLKAYAKTTLSAVNQHLNMAKGDLAKLGGAMPGGSMGGSMSGGSMGGSTSGGSMGGSTSGSGSTSGGTTTGTPGSSTSGGSMASPMPRPSTSPASVNGITTGSPNTVVPIGPTPGVGGRMSPSPSPRPMQR